MPSARKLSFASLNDAMIVRPLRWWLYLIAVTALGGQVPPAFATPKQPIMASVIRQTSAIDCGLAALAMLLRDKASITTSVAALDNLAAVLVDPTTARHRREGYSVSELQTLTAAFTHSLQARNLTSRSSMTVHSPSSHGLIQGTEDISRWWRKRPQHRSRWQTPLADAYRLALTRGVSFGFRKRQALSLSWNERAK